MKYLRYSGLNIFLPISLYNRLKKLENFFLRDYKSLLEDIILEFIEKDFDDFIYYLEKKQEKKKRLVFTHDETIYLKYLQAFAPSPINKLEFEFFILSCIYYLIERKYRKLFKLTS